MKKRNRRVRNVLLGGLIFLAVPAVLFLAATAADTLRPDLKLGRADAGLMISREQIEKTAAEKSGLLPDKRDYYDSLAVNEEYAAGIVTAANAISSSAEAKYFTDNLSDEAEEPAISVKEKADLEPAFYRYWQIKEEEPERYYEGSYMISTVTPSFGSKARISSDSDFVARLEEAGYRGLRDWMLKAEEAFRLFKAQQGGSSLPSYKTVIGGAEFEYTENNISVRFSWDSYYVRPDLLPEIQTYTGDSYRLRKTASAGGLSMLEYCTPSPTDRVTRDSAAKRIRLYYRDGVMCRIAVIASKRQSAALFSGQEKEMTLRFFTGLGMKEEEALKLFENLSDGSAMEKSGRAGEFEWKMEKTAGIGRTVYSIVIGEAEF